MENITQNKEELVGEIHSHENFNKYLEDFAGQYLETLSKERLKEIWKDLNHTQEIERKNK